MVSTKDIKDAGDATDSQESVGEVFSPADTTFQSIDSEALPTPEKEPKAASAPKRCNRWLPLFIGVAVLAAIGAGIYFLMDSNEVALNKSEVQHQDFLGTVSKKELFAHSEPDDCWMLIGDSVYDLTDYAPKHPGGADLVTDFCGTDGTKEYEMTHPLSLMRTIPETLLGQIEQGYVAPVEDEDEEEEDDGFVYVPPTVDETEPPVETDPPILVLVPTDAPAPTDASEPVPSAPPVAGEPLETEAPGTEPPVAAPTAVPAVPGTETPVDIIFDFSPTTAFISEMHYDNVGGDVNQMIEVAFSNQLDVSGYTVEFYRGRTGKVYDVQSLQAFTIGESVNGLTFASRKVASFQNGPDGVALIDGNANIVEFLSYGGIIEPEEGVAAGMLSTDIGIEQSGFDPIGHTIQKTGAGCMGSDFTWGVITEGTPGNVNADMQVTCYAAGAAVPAPAPWAETLTPTATCFADHFDLGTIALHDTNGDCWEAIFGIVYDFTEYIDEHSGGPDDILIHCGTDTTEAYLDRHSRGLMKYVTQHIIGRVTETAEGTFAIPCERRLEHADSGYWDYDWKDVNEFEDFDWESVEEEAKN